MRSHTAGRYLRQVRQAIHMLSDVGLTAARCARLGKQCVFRPARRRDNSAKRDSRIQALEAQVQDLLRPIPKSAVPLAQQPLPENHTVSVHSLSPPNDDFHADGDVIDEDIVSIERAETLVEMYKLDMMPHFPFVILAPNVTGRQLRHEKPFLFLAVLSVACFHDLNTQDKLGNRFKYMVSEKVLLGGWDMLKIEYLQGLLISLAWNQYHSRSMYYSQYLALAISIAVDMRLDRKHLRASKSSSSSAQERRDPIASRDEPWGPEEQRASAGCFYLASTISKLFDKMNSFQCTPFIEEGCRTLRESGEYRTDRDLYHVIRLQRIIESIETLAAQSTSESQAHAAFLRVRSELEEFRVHLASNVTDSHLLFMQFHTAKLFLYQVAFFERNLQHSPTLNLLMLCEGLEGAKSFLDLYLWLPPKSEMNLTNSEWLQLSFGITLAAKFAIVSKDPTVEPQTRELRHRLNIDHVFRHLTLRIGALVGRAGEGDKKRDIFYMYEQRVRKIQTWFERMVKRTASDSPQQSNTEASPASNQQTSHSPQTGMSPYPTSQYQLSHPHHQQQFQQQQTSYSTGSMEPPSNQISPSIGSVGVPYQSYSPMPAIAFPDLMNAPGWDTMFDIPMLDDPFLFDLPVSYNGSNMTSPPSEGAWDSPTASSNNQ
ncbi:hypothetical protein BDV95DRAFT_57697 [Massariosphaeria phaeospora]|uniref:Transcription factor domain-containing protein n=1 Tax=Massariosphaeria phaeospora TaxID=100035 RepID=A0A7C8I5C5_9PLEO|nr:hypothetical protein BDV95DRAFT_57697 [Massariosphaeria phaeospora]